MDERIPSNTRRWPVQKRSQDRLERVLRIAEGLIVERGFANLNVRELADIANVNISTIYACFPNSKAILRFLAVRYIEEIEDKLESWLGEIARSDSAEMMVDQLIDKFIQFYEDYPSWKAIWRGVQSDSELLAMDMEDTRATAAHFGALLKLINPALSDNVELTAMVLITINGAVIRLASELSVREREAAHRQLRQLARRMLIF